MRPTAAHPRPARPLAVLALLGALTACAPPSASISLGESSTAPQASGSSGTPDLASPASGMRWVSMLDVAVQVPAEWGYGVALDSSWCADRGDEASPTPVSRRPFVALHSFARAVPAILCATPRPPGSLQAEHVEWAFRASGQADGDVAHDGWVYTSRAVGSAYVTYVHRPGSAAGRILDTARVVSIDPNGCPVSAAGGLDARPAVVALPAAPTGGVVCQYGLPATGPNLLGSRSLSAVEASGLLAAVTAAPTLPGPAEEGPNACLSGPDDPTTRVVARLDGPGGGGQVWLTVGACRLATLDDGGGYRRATPEACRALLTPPAAWYGWSTEDAACFRG